MKRQGLIILLLCIKCLASDEGDAPMIDHDFGVAPTCTEMGGDPFLRGPFSLESFLYSPRRAICHTLRIKGNANREFVRAAAYIASKYTAAELLFFMSLEPIEDLEQATVAENVEERARHRCLRLCMNEGGEFDFEIAKSLLVVEHRRKEIFPTPLITATILFLEQTLEQAPQEH
ncbi:hypothetical protein HN446_00965 [bacterium]|jgi:hypothetical protein|nr:hypothetical protein [bacterium]